jgi:uncharacterized phage-like protein YoqJ
MTVLAVTGHRPRLVGGYGPEAEKRRFLFAREILSEEQPRRVNVGMAIGWDMAVAEACVDLGIPFMAAIPFEGQEQYWPADSQRQYRRLLRGASEVVTVCRPPYSITEAMQLRNEWLVDNADHLSALWNGSGSGTGNCVAYAKHVGKPWSNLWARWSSGLPADSWDLLGC